MKKKIVWVATTIIVILVAVVIIDSLPKKPYEKLNSDNVMSIEIYAMNPVPPAIKIVEDRDTINKIVGILKTVETTHWVYKGNTGGQLVRFTLTLNNGQIIEIGVYGNNINFRKANYEVCDKLNGLGNRILETGF